MNTIRWGAAVCFIALAATATAEDKKPKKFPEAVERAQAASEVEIVALDGESKEAGNWRGWKVTKRAATTKADESEKVTATLMKGVADGDSGAKCFIPRHGVRVVDEKTTYDLVICFECHWVYVYTDGEKEPAKFATTNAAEKVLNDFLSKGK